MRPLRRVNRRGFRSVLFAGLALALAAMAGSIPSGDVGAGASFKPGEKVVVKGQILFIEKVENGKLALAAPQPPTQTLGEFITPVDAKASSSQSGAGRTPSKMVDGSGWGETFPGSGLYIHNNNVYADGNCMWNGEWKAWLLFDLGGEYNVNGFYVWNYNEKDGWNTRGVKEVEIAASPDGQNFTTVGAFTLEIGTGVEDYKGQVVPFEKVVRARHFKWQIKSNYRGGEMSGIAEVRFSNADVKAPPPVPADWKPKYPRPSHPTLASGSPLAGAENIVFPEDAGVVDVTKPPCGARGDGKTDDTTAIQKALDEHPNKGAIIYLPNGMYRVSDTLRWPHGKGGGSEEKRTVLQGQSRAGTIIMLRDDCPGFENPRKPKPVIWTGRAPAQRFGNEIHNLTIDTGVGNPGACGVQFIANNQGGMYDVTIVSGDGFGVIGLDMGHTDDQGPCLIKNVRVVGFDTGVCLANSVASETMEHVEVERQNKAGFRNGGQPCTVRDLRSVNEVPAFRATAGFTTLIDCDFKGVGEAAKHPAVVNDGVMIARNIKTSGYRVALENRSDEGTREVAGQHIDQFLSEPASSLFGAPGKGLNLPVKETPEAPWDDFKDWVGPHKFGGKIEDGQDDSEAIQKAIDSGATTVYLPRGGYHIGRTIAIRGNVRRLMGCKAWLNIIEPLRGQDNPVFRFEDGAQPVVAVEGIDTDFSKGPYCFMENASKRTLVLRRLGINFQGADAYRGEGPGAVFIEDVVGRGFRFKNQTVWARQFNVEGDGTHILNDGGTVWILGYKTEGGGTLLETKNGGKTELLGGLSYTGRNKGKAAPMFVVDNAKCSISFSEVSFSEGPFAVIVREIRNGVTREMKDTDPTWGRRLTLFTAGTFSP